MPPQNDAQTSAARPANSVARSRRGRIALPFAIAAAVPALTLHAQQTFTPELTFDDAIAEAAGHNASLGTARLETLRVVTDLAANRTKFLPNLQVNVLGSQLLTRPSITFGAGSLGNYPATAPILATDAQHGGADEQRSYEASPVQGKGAPRFVGGIAS